MAGLFTLLTMRVNVRVDWTGRPIRIYKSKSKGLLLGEFSCYTEFLKLESLHRMTGTMSKGGNNTARGQIHLMLEGGTKSIYSHHYDCRIAIKLFKNERTTDKPVGQGNH
jgi:hypothetical protein